MNSLFNNKKNENENAEALDNTMVKSLGSE
jgi:hypothetical protein